MAVVRNLGVLVYLVRTRQLRTTDMLLLHEGNISICDQRFLNFFAFGFLKFVDVSETFFHQAPQELKSGERLGYSLMCRFQYVGVWQYLSDYGACMRVDEDVLILRAPKFNTRQKFIAGAMSEETHTPTNETLPQVLSEFGMKNFYDHEFPYTNVFMSSVDIWLTSEAKSILKKISNHQL